MQIFIDILIAMAVGGAVCFLGQILINKTKMTTARILVIYLMIGVVLETFNLFKPIKEFAGAGITVPIIGFGSSLVNGAREGAKQGLLEAVSGGLSAVAGGLSAVIFFGFLFALIFKSHSKRKK